MVIADCLALRVRRCKVSLRAYHWISKPLAWMRLLMHASYICLERYSCTLEVCSYRLTASSFDIIVHQSMSCAKLLSICSCLVLTVVCVLMCVFVLRFLHCAKILFLKYRRWKKREVALTSFGTMELEKYQDMWVWFLQASRSFLNPPGSKETPWNIFFRTRLFT